MKEEPLGQQEMKRKMGKLGQEQGVAWAHFRDALTRSDSRSGKPPPLQCLCPHL